MLMTLMLKRCALKLGSKNVVKCSMTAVVPKVVFRLARKRRKDRLIRYSLDNAKALELMSSNSYLSVLKQQVLTSPSEWRAVVSTAILVGSCCSFESIGAM